MPFFNRLKSWRSLGQGKVRCLKKKSKGNASSLRDNLVLLALFLFHAAQEGPNNFFLKFPQLVKVLLYLLTLQPFSMRN